MEEFNQLREQYKEFIYDSFNVEELEDSIRITYKYILGEHTFNHKLEIEKRDFFKYDNLQYKDAFAFNLGIVGIVNYYKLACPKKIIIKAGKIDDYQKAWWQKLFYKGLGEFRYINEIDISMEEFVEFESQSERIFKPVKLNTEGNIVPIGGGKDSIVTIERVKEDNNIPLILNPRGATIDTAKIAGYELNDCIIIKRIFDKQMIQMNKEGYLNGHVPFSAVLAFISMFAALISNRKYIILSNEASANESTVKNQDINHQYSKTFEMERDLDEYFAKYLTRDIKYFSLLRSISELQIAKEFAEHKQYHKIFRSCNVGSRNGNNEWCLECPKCLFVYIILAAFMERKEIIDVFGKELLDDKELLKYFEELCGASENKPFECVGTRDEVNISLSILLKKYNELPCLLQYYKDNLGYLIKSDEEIEKALNYYNEENLIPKRFL